MTPHSSGSHAWRSQNGRRRRYFISFLLGKITPSDSWWRISNVSVGLRTIMEASCMPNKVFILPAVKIDPGHGCSESFGSLPS